MKLGKTNIILNQILYTNYSAIIFIKYSKHMYKTMCGAVLLPLSVCGSRAGMPVPGERPPVITSVRPEVGIQEFVPPLRGSSCAETTKASLRHAWALFPPAQSQCAMTKWRRLGLGHIRVKLHFTRIFNQHKYKTHIYNIYI